jgi:hypothetical protein
MTVNSIGGSNVQFDPSLLQRPTPPPMENTAALLGMSTDDLTTAEQAGTTLSAIAAQKGVSKDDLVNAIASDLKTDAPQGAPTLSDDQLTQMATNIADGKRPHRAGHHHHQQQETGEAAGAQDDRSQQNLSSLADALGLDPSTLTAALNTDGGLATLLGNMGVTGYGTSEASTLTSGLAFDEYA